MDYLDEWNSQQQARAATWKRKQRELHRALEEIEVRTVSPNGEVGITADAHGRITDIRFTPQGLRAGDARLNRVVLETIQRAQEEAKRKATDAARPFIDDPQARSAKAALRELLADLPDDKHK